MNMLHGTVYEATLNRGLELCRDGQSVGFRNPHLREAFASTFATVR
jgi:hypothetical protein